MSARSDQARPRTAVDRAIAASAPPGQPETAPERRDATGATACPDCGGKLAAQLSILPVAEHLVRCLDCGAELVARSRPA